jgi:hypothetical protein
MSVKVVQDFGRISVRILVKSEKLKVKSYLIKSKIKNQK